MSPGSLRCDQRRWPISGSSSACTSVLGLDKIEDTLDAIWNEQDAPRDRISAGEPKTVAGALAIARVCLLEVGEAHLVNEDDECMHEAVLAGLRALDAGDALLERGRAPA